MAVADLVVRLTAESKGLTGPLSAAKKDIDGLGNSSMTSSGKLGGLASKFQGLGPVAQGAVLGAGAAVVGIAAKGISAFGDFDKGMREVFTLMPGVSKDAMGKMEADVRALSKEMGITTDQTVPALYQAISAGVPQDNVFDFMEVASKAAIGGVTDLETAVDGITSATNAYGIENLSAQDAADKMFTAVKLGKTNFEQLSGALFQVAPIASGLGVNFDDISAALAALTAQGVPTSVAATQIKSAMAELGKEGSIAFKNFEAATGKTFPQFIAEGGNLQEALAAMKDHADKTGTGVQNLFGSIEAGQSALALTSQSGGPAFVNAMEAMADSTGAVDEAFTTMSEGQDFKMKQMKAAVSDAFISIGAALAPLVSTILPILTSLLGLVTPAFEALGQVIGAVNTVLNPVVGALGAVTDVLGKLPTPIDAVKGGLGLLSDGFNFLTGRSKETEQQFRDFDETARNAAWADRYSGLADQFKDDYGMGGTVPRAFTETEQAAKTNVEAMRARVDELGESLMTSEDHWQKWEDEIAASGKAAVSLFDGAAEEMEISNEEMLTNLADTVRQKQDWVESIRTLTEMGMDALAGELEAAGPKATSTFDTFIADPLLGAAAEMAFDDPMNENVADMLDLLASKDPQLQRQGREMFASITTGLNTQAAAYPLTIRTPDWESNWASNTAMMSQRWQSQMQANLSALKFRVETWQFQVSAPRISASVSGGGAQIYAFAGGGIVSPNQVALVGEQGPELAVFGRQAEIIPHNQAASWLQQNAPAANRIGMTGGTLTGGEPLHIHLEIDGREVADVVLDQQKRELARNGVRL